MKTLINLIKKAASTITGANPVRTLVAISFIGSVIVIGSLVKEVTFQSDLLTQHGYAALMSYRALILAHQASNLSDYVLKALTGDMPAVSARIRGVGYLVTFVISPAATSVLVFAKMIRNAVSNPQSARAV